VTLEPGGEEKEVRVAVWPREFAGAVLLNYRGKLPDKVSGRFVDAPAGADFLMLRLKAEEGAEPASEEVTLELKSPDGKVVLDVGKLTVRVRWPRTLTTPLVRAGKKLDMEFVLIQADAPTDTFQMGSPDGEKDRQEDEQQHPVPTPRPFYMGVYLVTQAQYEQVMGKNPSHYAATGDYNTQVAGLDTSRFPVENVTWRDAKKFCEELTRRSARRGWEFRLPTEAEWEYACRAGTTTPFSFGKVLNGKQANCNGNDPYGTEVKGPYLDRPCRVGSYGANAWGLYDMHGNVREWCVDPYDRTYGLGKEPEPVTDLRVVRGGYWGAPAAQCRSAYRFRLHETRDHDGSTGFRVVYAPQREKVRKTDK
jgi:formylglycine-generating enzyme required for sulfatase activity